MQPKTFLKTVSLIHIALVSGLCIFLIFVCFQIENSSVSLDSTNVFIYIVPCLAIISYFGSTAIFQKLIKEIDSSEALEKKLKKYQTASIVKYALIEGPCLVAIVAYYSTTNNLHLVIAISLIVYLYVQKPNKETILKDIPLNSEERKKIRCKIHYYYR